MKTAVTRWLHSVASEHIWPHMESRVLSAVANGDIGFTCRKMYPVREDAVTKAEKLRTRGFWPWFLERHPELSALICVEQLEFMDDLGETVFYSPRVEIGENNDPE